MKRAGRPLDPDFAPSECLYRRISPTSFQNGEIDVDAVNLPDVSTMRSKYTPQPEWVLIDPDRGYDFRHWGIAQVRVDGIPKMSRGIVKFSPCHDPSENNYPHTEIRAYDATGEHLTGMPIARLLSPEVHLDFRERLLRKMTILQQPSEPSR